jgi:uroporphyrinogen decarboxylase
MSSGNKRIATFFLLLKPEAYLWRKWRINQVSLKFQFIHMNSRERILAAFAHSEPDRVPIDFGCHRSSGISAQAYVKLRSFLGLPPSKLYVYDFIQQLACIEDDVLDIIGADVVNVGHGYYKIDDYWKDWNLPDGSPCKIPAFIEVEKENDSWVVRGDEGQVICIQKKGMLFFEQTCFPLCDNEEDNTFEKIEYYLKQVMWARLGAPPSPAGLDGAGQMIRRKHAKALRESTDRAIYGTFGGNLVENGQFVFRIDNFLVQLLSAPDRIHTFLDKLTELHLANLEKYLNAVGPYIDIIGFGDDMGTQTGPQFSPEIYREFFKPRHKLLWNKAKELCPGIKVGLHCCGGVYPLLGDMIEAGLDAINPVQFICTDMGTERLKREFGKDLVFWGGGCDTQSILPNGTPRQVSEHVKRQVEVLSPGGGFVFQQVHNILANVPPENIMAMFNAIR